MKQHNNLHESTMLLTPEQQRVLGLPVAELQPQDVSTYAEAAAAELTMSLQRIQNPNTIAVTGWCVGGTIRRMLHRREVAAAVCSEATAYLTHWDNIVECYTINTDNEGL